MFKLVIEDDEGNKTIVPVIRDEITIGRQEGNTIRLTERNVSRHHAKLVRENGVVYFEEVSPRYGTRVNGERMQERMKFDVGDIFMVGDYRLTLQPEAKAGVGLASAPVAPVASAPSPMISGGTEMMPAQPARLVIVSSNFAGQEFPLDRKEVVVGRGEECDIIVDHRSVSTTHAKIVREVKGRYKIIDINSKNGVKVSGEEYKAVHLKRGDVIELGHVHFRFVEPGENYVFTPMAYSDYAEPPPSNNKPILGVIGLLVAAAIMGAIAWVVWQSDAGSPTPVATSQKQASRVVADIPEPDANERVDHIVTSAQGHIKRGEMEKAIAKLDTAKELEPTPGQAKIIDRLLSDARAWAPVARTFAIGKDYFDREQYPDALAKFKEVGADDSTPIYALMMEGDYPKKTLDELMKSATEASESGDNERARKLANDILGFDAEHTQAAALIAQLDAPAEEPKQEVAVAKPVQKEKPPRQRRPTSKDEKKPSIDLVKGEEVYKRAFDEYTMRNFSSAIKICKEALNKYRYGQCYPVIAASYRMLGDVDKACVYFKRGGMQESCDELRKGK